MGSGRKRCGDSILGQLVGILCDLNSRADRLGVKIVNEGNPGMASSQQEVPDRLEVGQATDRKIHRRGDVPRDRIKVVADDPSSPNPA